MATGRTNKFLKGFTLVELMIGLAIFSILLSMAAPSFSTWIQNSQIRTAAESIQNGLQEARAEAVRRNTAVRFQLVSSLDGSCAVSGSGQNWVVNMTSDAAPDGHCGDANSDSTSPYILKKSPAGQSGANVTINAGQAVVAFNGLGRLTSTLNPTTTPGSSTIDITSPTTACVSATGSGTARCLRIVISPAGLIRMCDPNVSSGSTLTESMKCS